MYSVSKSVNNTMRIIGRVSRYPNKLKFNVPQLTLQFHVQQD